MDDEKDECDLDAAAGQPGPADDQLLFPGERGYDRRRDPAAGVLCPELLLEQPTLKTEDCVPAPPESGFPFRYPGDDLAARGVSSLPLSIKADTRPSRAGVCFLIRKEFLGFCAKGMILPTDGGRKPVKRQMVSSSDASFCVDRLAVCRRKMECGDH